MGQLSGFQSYLIGKMQAGNVLSAPVLENGRVGIYTLKTPDGVFVRSVSVATVQRFRDLNLVEFKTEDGRRIVSLKK